MNDPSLWRLTLPNGVKYRRMENYPNGVVTLEQGWTVKDKWIIQASDLVTMMETDFFPTGLLLSDGGWYYSSGLICPAFPSSHLVVDSVEFNPLEKSLPIDPEGVDPGAPEGTYGQFVTVDVTFKIPTSSNTLSGGGGGDIEPYLEISSSGSAEFLTVNPTSGAKWASGQPVQPSVTIPIIAPTIEWTATYPRMNVASLVSVINAKRTILGTINSNTMTTLAGATPGTVLFTAISFNRGWTYNISDPSNSLYRLELHFQEKPIGHNYFYNENTGDFEAIYINGNPPYQSTNLLF